MRTFQLLVFVILSGLLAPATPSLFGQDATPETVEIPAEPTEEALARAREAFGDGNGAYLEGRYRDAVRHFERANNIVPNPRLLEYMARCYTNLGDYAQAITSYEAFADTSDEAAAEVAEILVGLRHDAMVNAIYKASDSVDDALAAANGETPPPRDLRRQELGTQMRDVAVQIRTTPRGADVFIDAIELGAVGQTPLETPLFRIGS
jgi:tetratricopeptide (TPR) repeat protein